MTDDLGKKTWTEELIIDSKELVNEVRKLIAAGNVRKVIIRRRNDEVLLEIPMTAGVAVGTAAVLFAPVLAAVGALAALIAEVKIQIVRTGDKDTSDSPDSR